MVLLLLLLLLLRTVRLCDDMMAAFTKTVEKTLEID